MVNLSALLPALAVLGYAQATRFLGRVNPSTKELTWAGTGLSFNFQGTQATINFSKVTGTDSLALYIDGGAPTIINSISGNSISTPKLKSGKHSVVLLKRSETDFGTLFYQGVTTDGTIGKDTPSSRRIEYIGDSITVGYGADGKFPCTNTAALEDAPKTYGALTANNVSADYSIVAWSGKGVTRNYVIAGTDTSPIMPELWTRYGANDADNSYTFPAASTPQAVLINLGTNDYSYQGQAANGSTVALRPQLNVTAFEQAYLKFVQTVLKHYPDADYFLTSSPLLSDSTSEMQHTTHVNAIKGVIASINSPKMHFVDFPTQPGTEDTIGCDYHPGLIEHQTLANILTPIIKSAMKW